MPTYQFTATESIGVPENITITDTSVSPDGGLTEKRVYLRLANGNYLTSDGESETPTYTVWPIGDVSITISCLTQSTAIDVTVTWMTGSTITGEASESVAFDEFDYLFAYDLIGSETSDPSIVQDSNYYSNFIQFIVNLFNAENAVTTGADIWSSQQQLNKNYIMEQNQTKFF